MKNTIDFDEVIADAINSQKGKASENKLARARAAAWSATSWKLRQGAQPLVDAESDSAGCFRTVMILGVIANICQVARRALSIGCASASIPAVNQLADVPMVNEFATVGGTQSFPHFVQKPLVVVHEAFYSLLHQGVRIATALGGKPSKRACRSGLRFTSMPQE